MIASITFTAGPDDDTTALVTRRPPGTQVALPDTVRSNGVPGPESATTTPEPSPNPYSTTGTTPPPGSPVTVQVNCVDAVPPC